MFVFGGLALAVLMVGHWIYQDIMIDELPADYFRCILDRFAEPAIQQVLARFTHRFVIFSSGRTELWRSVRGTLSPTETRIALNQISCCS
jgi:hypothetical protein